MSHKVCAFIDCQLYLPNDWINNSILRQAAHVPDSLRFVTKPEIAAQMIEQAIVAGVPFARLAADTIYGVGRIEMQLRRAGKGYVLSAHAADQFSSWIDKPEVVGFGSCTTTTPSRDCADV